MGLLSVAVSSSCSRERWREKTKERRGSHSRARLGIDKRGEEVYSVRRLKLLRKPWRWDVDPEAPAGICWE